ncbi:MAG: TonB-dependent receptor [Enterobacterales bacterium]|jgi:TonB-dependent receptor
MDTKIFLKNAIAKGVSLALGATILSPIYAQENVDESTSQAEQAVPVEEEEDEDYNIVTVTGIRGSLMRSMDTKRNSAGVVDAINSEDIGKFPDTNLAESLQRITGVSIDRSQGEGSRVTVRGFGADFNLVTLNGRQMPTNSGLGRSFDFADLASEGVAGVEIYKTGRASVPTGGIGATINILSLRPLESPGLNASFGLKAVNDTSTIEGDAFTPEFSGVFSDTFFDDTFGVAITASIQERNNGQQSVNNSRWFERDGADVPDNGQQTNLPSAGDIAAIPQQFVYSLDEWERSRKNGQLTLQYQPIDSLVATLDYTYAGLTSDHRYNNMSIWFSPSAQSATWSDGPIVSPLIYTESNDQPDFPHGAGVDASKNKLNSIGLNLRWDATDRLRLKFDHHDSTSQRSPNSIYGSSAGLSASAFTRSSATVNLQGDIPVVTTVASDPLSPDDMQITGSTFANSWAEMNIQQTHFDGAFEVDADQTIDFGISVSKVTNFEASSLVQRNTWGQNQASAYGAISDLVTPASLSGVYDEFSSGADINNNFFTYDMIELIKRAEFLQGLDPSNPLYLAPGSLGGDCGTGLCADSNPGFGNQFIEESKAAYIQYNLIGDIGDYPFNLFVGLRYEETDVTSSSESKDYTRIEWASTNEFNVVEADESITSGLTGSYDFILPSLDFDIELRHDIKARYSYSETIARSGYGDLVGSLSVSNVLRRTGNDLQDAGTGTLGNPGLIPHQSANNDISVEWYYDDASYVSIGGFHKAVENFVSGVEVKGFEVFEGLAHPGFGPLYDDAVTALGAGANNASIREYIFANFANEPGVDVANGVITGVIGRDSAALFDVQTRANSNDIANISGWEAAWQHDFVDTGFGFIVNATFVSGDVDFDRFSDEPQFAVPGLSDTRNMIVYYDRDGIQVRIAYNWRDSFFAGGSTQPGYVDEYEQWDINASYEVNHSLSFFVEAINVTSETNRSYARDYSQVNFVGQTGPRYNIGFRYTFN